MGYVLKLPTAGDSSLPTLGDVGYISKVGLKGLYLVNGGTGLTDASGNGNDMSLGTGDTTPPYSAGVLQFRRAAAGTAGQFLTTGIQIAGAEQTLIAMVNKVSSPSIAMALFAHLGASIAKNAAGPMTVLLNDDAATGLRTKNYGLQNKEAAITAPTNFVGQWVMWSARRNATSVALSLNGQASTVVNYDTTDDGSGTTNAVGLGETNTNNLRRPDMDIGFFAVYERALPDAEIASVYKAARRLMAGKGITI